ncbi:MAG: hypothetical protein HWN67_05440 [Candidatus Helarchaeota archaeon]|nr:hypothetical protein [Candidatus Helarchaeota archaeon]
MDAINYIPERRDFIQNIVEVELYDYVTDINRRWNSNIFPSSSLAKAILKNLHESRKKYRKYHTLVKKVLNKWATLGFCKLISMTSLPSGKKTKFIYQFEFDKMKNVQVVKLLPLTI